MKKVMMILTVLITTLNGTAQANWVSQLKAMVPKTSDVTETSLSETQVGKAIREALSVGIDKAVAAASQKGGYLDNEAIKIKFPDKFSMIENGLRKAGMGEKIDEFEVSVNSAAEKAAPQAKEILLDALMDMSIDDAKNLLSGGDTAATDYFRKSSSDRLYEAFQPYIQNAMEEYRVTQAYNQVIESYSKIPLAKKPNLVSADKYAIDKALDGLFHLVAEQEKKIRTDPSARATELLKTVFGKA